MNELIPNFTCFSRAQRVAWPHFTPLAEQGFVLYGGMGLSARLGHRGSLDFDFFSSRPIDRARLHRDLPLLEASTTLQNERGTYTVSVPIGDEQVKLSFFGALKIPRVGEPTITSDHVCQVASMDDLAGTKLSAILDRIQASDYRDVLAIVASGYTLEDAIAATTALYGNSFQPMDILKALTYFEHEELDELTSHERARLNALVNHVRAIPERTTISRDLAIAPDRIKMMVKEPRHLEARDGVRGR